MENRNKPDEVVFSYCSIELDSLDYSRRCFMTGEYCSKQDTIQRERQQLRGKMGPKPTNEVEPEINAFVVMNYSSVSDVIYKWKIQNFIESIKNYFYFNESLSRLYCFNRQHRQSGESFISDAVIREVAEKEGIPIDTLKSQLRRPLGDHKKLEGDRLIPVHNINVIRADSNPSTNFVMCNRICQQLQIADLVIVDVSVENANVFYELGMAVALGKMILPICYSETYYRMSLPESIKEIKEETQRRRLEHHIDCYPWRRTLFEHFGIRYRNGTKGYTEKINSLWENNSLVVAESGDNSWVTQYLDFDEISKEQYGFKDKDLAKFPYLDKLDSLTKIGQTLNGFNQIPGINGQIGNHTIGECIYRKLQTAYNLSTCDENTLVIYSMEGFLNDAQAAHCIVNYYNAIVRQFREQRCFCGERVGVLLQPNPVPEDPKDGKQMLHYNVGEVIQIGMNQATYRTNMEMIKPDNYLIPQIKIKREEFEPYEKNILFERWVSNAEKQAKAFVRNRCLSIYPNNPIYVKRITDGLQLDIFEDIKLDSTNFSVPGKNQPLKSSIESSEEDAKTIEAKMARLFYCYYHVMLRTLRYTNEIVVDIGKNTLQSYFWLGAAHAADTNAITVRHVQTDWEKTASEENAKKDRRIFDVSGLWTAVYRTNDADSFFSQLYQAQAGIEHYSKLILKNRKTIEDHALDSFWKPKADQSGINAAKAEKEKGEDETLEAYYRNRYWRSMLRCNRLHIYVREQQIVGREPYIEKWDIDSVSFFSNYLSRKKAISDYKIMPLNEEHLDDDALSVNFICIGNETGIAITKHQNKELEADTSVTKRDVHQNITSYFNSMLDDADKVYQRDNEARYYPCSDCTEQGNQAMAKQYCSEDKTQTWATQLPSKSCYSCLSKWAECNMENRAEICDGHDRLILRSIPPKENSCKLLKNHFRFISDKPGERCVFHMELAQVILWREASDHYRVTISGASGPATLALSSVFVSKAVKKGVMPEPIAIEDDTTINSDEWLDELKKRYYPLCTLQESIRRQIYSRYEKIVEESLSNMVNTHYPIDTTPTDDLKKLKARERQRLANNLYVKRVITSVEIYLSTVLYRYFFPFVTKEDIERICNGVKMYTAALRVNNCSPFAMNYPRNVYDDFDQVMGNQVVFEAASIAQLSLYDILTKLRGVEVFYEVVVKNQIENEENQRTLAGIVQSTTIPLKPLFEKKPKSSNPTDQ